MSKNEGKSSFQLLDSASAVGFLAYSASVTVTPISLVILANELNFSLTAGGALEVARSVPLFAMLLTAAVVAGRWGKVRALAFSCFALAAGMWMYSFAHNYTFVLIALALLGAGGGLLEALINPLTQDLHPKDSGRYLNIINGFWSIGVLLTVLIGGELLTRDVSWRFLVAGLGVLSALAGFFYIVARHQQPEGPRHRASDVLGHKMEILRLKHFWTIVPMMFFGGAVEGAYLFWSASYIQIDFEASPRAAGIGTALFAMGMIIGRFAIGWLLKQESLWRLIVGSVILGFVVSLAVPFTDSLWLLYGLLFLAGLSVASFWPSIQSYAADRLPVETTSLFILLSCAGLPGFAFASWLLGYIGEHAGLTWSFGTVPILFLLLGIFSLVEREMDSHSRQSQKTKA
ncbi:MFS transporter [Rubellicoccus peritrichatus]|uniref:MFS transporter n=1 Tax=Rubellicoccus peritrichatus TaxID=3080537 RepID=A0AAQ3LEA7_9BACT|nr:MFS transporter [Puniceicoccus sp. CR14]WOO43087.1 MFS transporter [Puniceicoccus sp. CR14]